MAEYISLLSDDAAVQMQTVDKFIEAVKAKQEKVDPIEALELNDEIAFWEGVNSSNVSGNLSEDNLEMGADVLGRNNKLLFDNENNKGKVARY